MGTSSRPERIPATHPSQRQPVSISAMFFIFEFSEEEKMKIEGSSCLLEEMRRLRGPVAVYLLTITNRPPATQANTPILGAILLHQSFQCWERKNGITAVRPSGTPAIPPTSVLAEHMPRQVISSAISVLEFTGTRSTSG
jgi:hypothetical protein